MLADLDKLIASAGGNGGGRDRFIVTPAPIVKSLGQQFIESDAGKYLRDTKGTRSGTWRSPAVELKAGFTRTDAGKFRARRSVAARQDRKKNDAHHR